MRPVSNDQGLLERFQAEARSQVPHIEEGRVVNPTPLIDVTATLLECARSEYGLRLGNGARVLAKLDSKITGGSVKVRPAVSILGDAISAGKLVKGQTVFEATSGNFGLALGWLRKLGIDVVVLVSRRLQQGVVDAGEGPVPSYWAMKHYEVAKYYSYTDTFISPALPMVGLRWFNAQPKEFQQAIEQAAREMIVKERQLMADQEEEATADLKSKGVQFNELKDKAAFMKMVEPIHKEYEARLGKELLEKARNPK